MENKKYHTIGRATICNTQIVDREKMETPIPPPTPNTQIRGLFNVQWTIFQLYHGENKLHSMKRWRRQPFTLHNTNTL